MCGKIPSHWQNGSHFSDFSKKMAAAASFSYKIGGGGPWQGFGNITCGCSDMVWILDCIALLL